MNWLRRLFARRKDDSGKEIPIDVQEDVAEDDFSKSACVVVVKEVGDDVNPIDDSSPLDFIFPSKTKREEERRSGPSKLSENLYFFRIRYRKAKLDKQENGFSLRREPGGLDSRQSFVALVEDAFGKPTRVIMTAQIDPTKFETPDKCVVVAAKDSKRAAAKIGEIIKSIDCEWAQHRDTPAVWVLDDGFVRRIPICPHAYKVKNGEDLGDLILCGTPVEESLSRWTGENGFCLLHDKAGDVGKKPVVDCPLRLFRWEVDPKKYDEYLSGFSFFFEIPKQEEEN